MQHGFVFVFISVPESLRLALPSPKPKGKRASGGKGKKSPRQSTPAQSPGQTPQSGLDELSKDLLSLNLNTSTSSNPSPASVPIGGARRKVKPTPQRESDSPLKLRDDTHAENKTVKTETHVRHPLMSLAVCFWWLVVYSSSNMVCWTAPDDPGVGGPWKFSWRGWPGELSAGGCWWSSHYDVSFRKCLWSTSHRFGNLLKLH